MPYPRGVADQCWQRRRPPLALLARFGDREERGKPVGCSWPVSLKGVHAGVCDGEAQPDRDEDRVVEVSEYRDEVGDQVDR